MAHITTREHGDVPGGGSYWGPRGCPGAVQNWPHPSPGHHGRAGFDGMRTEELASPLPRSSTLSMGPALHPGSTVELALVAGVVGELSLRVCAWES